MSILKPPSDDGSIVVVYRGDTGPGGNPFGPAQLFEDAAGYEGDQALTIVHLNDGSTVECRDVLMVRTSRKDAGASS
ncbi:hypothetical protein G3R41_08780 [Modestobacter muralis]|uniref:Uncharacterized protein n=1 Tax=Modestobacter muralis TaxID=1608614 RepID=A0A6P0HAJ2_9ACTN|nr:hypothetical protein [Modestobacter muralis]NEN51034.1 hypothetical protein [Modestobacter muralis]